MLWAWFGVSATPTQSSWPTSPRRRSWSFSIEQPGARESGAGRRPLSPRAGRLHEQTANPSQVVEQTPADSDVRRQLAQFQRCEPQGLLAAHGLLPRQTLNCGLYFFSRAFNGFQKQVEVIATRLNAGKRRLSARSDSIVVRPADNAGCSGHDSSGLQTQKHLCTSVAKRPRANSLILGASGNKSCSLNLNTGTISQRSSATDIPNDAAIHVRVLGNNPVLHPDDRPPGNFLACCGPHRFRFYARRSTTSYSRGTEDSSESAERHRRPHPR